MKLQNLVVIFVIIILPITMILTAYTQNQIKTLNYQTSYDTKLDNATYDALKAFQLNTINSSTSDLVNSKIRDIEAAANTFFDSISENFNMAGYRSDALKDYVPALVFTMYDGYYIYSLYDNKIDEETQSKLANNNTSGKSYGLKPYIYYSCRYVKGDLDVVISYALDNYISVQGIKGKDTINLSGYLIDGLTRDSNGNIKYRGVTIERDGEEVLNERLGNTDENTGNYVNYVKYNGVKYYQDGEKSYSIINGTKYTQDKLVRDKNTSAYHYYYDAMRLKERLEYWGITDLGISDAVDEEGKKLTTLVDDNGNIVYDFRSTEKIFQYNKDSVSIEEPKSTFNQHRLAIIRYAIEKNLSIAIANYNSFTEGNIEANFQMPRLKEEEWEKLVNNVSIISFLQGLNIGGKIYNGYSIVTNNKNEEVVTENSIYITDTNGNHHRATDTDLVGATNLVRGHFNVDFERKSLYQEFNNSGQKLYYYYPQEHLGCYNCIVSQDKVAHIDNIYDYMESIVNNINVDNKDLPLLYFTALGRERYSMYKVNRKEKQDKRILIYATERGRELTSLVDTLIDEYMVVDYVSITSSDIHRADISNEIKNATINGNYDLLICDAKAWDLPANIFNDDELECHVITISNDTRNDKTTLITYSQSNSTIGSGIKITPVYKEKSLKYVDIQAENDSGISKIKFAPDVQILCRAKYTINGVDDGVYDAIGLKTTYKGYKKIHSQFMLYSNYYSDSLIYLVKLAFK